VAFVSAVFFSRGCFAQCFVCVFGRFVTKGVKIRDKKIAFFFRSRQKKHSLTYVTFLFLSRPPCQGPGALVVYVVRGDICYLRFYINLFLEKPPFFTLLKKGNSKTKAPPGLTKTKYGFLPSLPVAFFCVFGFRKSQQGK
jgi:hypothetical protein